MAGIALACAQVVPAWVFNVPVPGNNTYLYSVESGTATTELEARNQAIVRVFQTMALRLGMPVNSQAISKAVQQGEAIEVISTSYNLPINKVCEYTERVMGGGFRVYVLCQVARAGNIMPQWDVFTECVDEQFMERAANWREQESKRWKQEEKKTEREERREYRRDRRWDWWDNIRDWNEDYSDGNYIAWGIINFEYPWAYTTSVNGRFGGTVGIGYAFSAGVNLTAAKELETEPAWDDTWVDSGYDDPSGYFPFHYSAEVRLFPYKKFFLSCSYGVIGANNEWYGHNKRQFPKTGWTFGIGLDILPDPYFFSSPYLSINARVSYDLVSKTWSPTVGFQFGVGWMLDSF